MTCRTAVLTCAATLIACAVPASVHAQYSLVLSGGGARGLSHAGALVALEELGYDPAVIVGTSMGAIIGALYAAGLDPERIRDIIGGENWLERFSAEPLLLGADRLPRRPLLAFGISHGRFHEGLVATTGVNQRLVELLFDAGVRAGGDFDELPRRYRAVAADLSTGEQVVLGSGDLPRAVRASMAVPGLFAPVEWQGRVLVDGGIINNLPVSVAWELSSNPVLAIDALRPAPAIDERSAPAVGVRAIRLLIANAMRHTPPPTVLVVPQLRSSLSESRFPADASELMAVGYRAVMEQAPRQAVGGPPASKRPAGEPPGRIDSLVVNGDAASARLVRRMMRAAVPGPYNGDAIARGTGALYATGLFQGVWPRVETSGGAATLVIDVIPVAATTLAAGAAWDNDAGAAGWAAVRQRLTLRTPWELRGSVELDQLGHRGALELAAFSTLFPGVTWNAGAHAEEERVRWLNGAEVRGHVEVRRAGGWLGYELHAPLREWFVSALLRGDRTESSWETRTTWGPFLRLARKPQPDRVVGADPLIQLEHRFGDDGYSLYRMRGSSTAAASRLRAAAIVELHMTRGMPPVDRMPATSRATAPWLPYGSLRGQHMIIAGADFAYPFILDGFLRVRLRALQARTAGSGGPRVGAELGGVWPTVVGNVEAGVAAGRGVRGPRLNLGVSTH